MMKAIKAVFWGAVFLIMAQPSVSMAVPYSGAWLPNDEDMFAIEVASNGADASFLMYDWGHSGSNMQILASGQRLQTVYFTLVDDTVWYASLLPEALTLNLGDNLEFGFSFLDGLDSFLIYDLVTDEAGESYTLTQTSCNPTMSVTISDASPIPDPAAIFLLGSACLIGFAAARRKFIK